MKKKYFKYIFALLLICMILKPIQTKAEGQTLPRLVDYADLLTDEEEVQLTEKLDAISLKRGCDIVVVTVDSLERKTAKAFADDFYDENGYGIGKNADGILLLISMTNRDWAISTCGYATEIFADAGQQYMADQFLPYLSNGEYARAFSKFAELCDRFIKNADSTKQDSGNSYSQKTVVGEGFPLMKTVLIFCGGFLLALITAIVQKSKLTSVRADKGAYSYMKSGSLQLEIEKDMFVRQYITTRTIEKPKSADGDVSSTHISTSGRAHGGSSGKF